MFRLSELRHHLPVETYVVGLAVLTWAVLAFASPYFWTSDNITNILRQVSISAIVAFGELFTIVMAGIDLSVGSVAGLTGIAFAMMLSSGTPVIVAVVAALLLGLVIGLVNGFAADRLGIPPFIVTLAGLQVYRGLALLLSGGMTVAGIPESVTAVANASVFGMPMLFIIMIVIGFGSHIMLRYTRLGRYMYAIGSNIEAARRVGINVTAVALAAYGLSAMFAAAGGALLVSRLSMGTPTAATGYELEAIAAAVVGGASLFGGRGTILGCFIGALLFTTIGDGANLLGVDPFWEMVVEGLLIAVVVYIDNLQKRRRTGL
jgi:ribose transport system permease protein